MERGKEAAAHLLDLFRAGGEPNLVAVNRIGLLFQSYEATAGLIGNTLLALASHPDLGESARAGPGFLRGIVSEVLRYDSPIQNTRRFVARLATVAGHEMKEGDGILVVLAAANRDPSANPNPDQFDVLRRDRRIFTFGLGAHACPGEALATTMAVAGVAELLRSGVEPARLRDTMTYRPSANVRVPLFGNP